MGKGQSKAGSYPGSGGRRSDPESFEPRNPLRRNRLRPLFPISTLRSQLSIVNLCQMDNRRPGQSDEVDGDSVSDASGSYIPLRSDISETNLKLFASPVNPHSPQEDTWETIPKRVDDRDRSGQLNINEIRYRNDPTAMIERASRGRERSSPDFGSIFPDQNVVANTPYANHFAGSTSRLDEVGYAPLIDRSFPPLSLPRSLRSDGNENYQSLYDLESTDRPPAPPPPRTVIPPVNTCSRDERPLPQFSHPQENYNAAYEQSKNTIGSVVVNGGQVHINFHMSPTLPAAVSSLTYVEKSAGVVREVDGEDCICVPVVNVIRHSVLNGELQYVAFEGREDESQQQQQQQRQSTVIYRRRISPGYEARRTAGNRQRDTVLINPVRPMVAAPSLPPPRRPPVRAPPPLIDRTVLVQA